jgi:hypothetical protein
MARVLGLIDRVGRRVAAPPPGFTRGNWYGNDTTWRTTLDLYRILFYADRDGRMRETPQRKVFSVVDGVVGGEGLGPMEPDARPDGVVMAGDNPALVDAQAAMLIGYDPARLSMIRTALKEFCADVPDPFGAGQIKVIHQGRERPLGEINLKFRPPPTWEAAAR